MFVDDEGVEPSFTESESIVLPLNESPKSNILYTNIYQFFVFLKRVGRVNPNIKR